MKRERICLYTTDPCWKRLLDAKKIKSYLLKNGYKVVDNPDDADTIVVVTCAFLNSITEFTLNKIKDLQQYNAELIVAGCLPEIDGEELSEIFNGQVLTTKELDDKIEILFPPKKNIRFKEIDDANILYKNVKQPGYIDYLKNILGKVKLLGKTIKEVKQFFLNYLVEKKPVTYFNLLEQYHIRVAWGCMGNCSYCAIKKATGKFHSKPLSECIKEFEKGLNQGYKNFVLDASDVGLYGVDLDSSFPELLNELMKKPGDYKITVREVHPNWVVKYIDKLEKILYKNKILIFDLSFQSMNKRILKLMRRYSDVEKIKDAVIRLKKVPKNVLFTCQFIIGFPTESWDEFLDSLLFIKNMDFDGGQIYLFSCKDGTSAEFIKPRISKEEMIKRLKYSKSLLQKAGFYVQYINKNNPVGLDFVKKRR